MTDHELKGLFRALKESVPNEANERVEQNVRLVFRVQKRRQNLWGEVCLSVAAAIALLLGMCFLLWHRRETTREAVAGRANYKDAEFVVLPYEQSDVPIEQPVIIIRVQIPASELGGLGVSMPSLVRATRVEADLLVGQDGIARAVRVNRQVKP